MGDTQKIAGLFPGQGSQSVGMGSDFINSSEQAKALMADADDALGFSLSKLCAEGPIEELTLTAHAQPALLTVAYIIFRESQLSLSCAAGHSLGEYTALVAAGCLEFSDAVQLVNKRGRYMQESVPEGQGKMAAVMGSSEDEISAVVSKLENGFVEIANLNCPGQTVVAGDAAGVDSFSVLMKEAGGKVIPLNVSAPFHCKLMQPAAEKLSADLDAISFSDPAFPVYANVTANKISSADEARELLKQQVCATVRWTQSMQNLIANEAPNQFVEFGPGGVLSKLMKRIDKSVPQLSIAKPEDLEKLP